jgi:hypothetical protein
MNTNRRCAIEFAAWMMSLCLSLAAGCGSGGPCESAGATVCAKACACRTDGKCAILITSGTNTQSLTLNASSDCVAEYRLVCGNSPAAHTVDFNACESGLNAASCVADPNNAGERALALPDACAPLW